jgi:uncharacterized alkaline shock family protein YloU
MLLAAYGIIPLSATNAFARDVYGNRDVAFVFIPVVIVMLLIAIRFVYLSARTGRTDAPSIDQRTEFGDIRISMDTVENLALKAANRSRGVKDLRARVKVSEAGLNIVIRAIVDGESSIPQMTEDMQAAIKSHVEDITGIPVAGVSVFVANVGQQSAPTFKSRVE